MQKLLIEGPRTVSGKHQLPVQNQAQAHRVLLLQACVLGVACSRALLSLRELEHHGPLGHRHEPGRCPAHLHTWVSSQVHVMFNITLLDTLRQDSGAHTACGQHTVTMRELAMPALIGPPLAVRVTRPTQGKLPPPFVSYPTPASAADTLSPIFVPTSTPDNASEQNEDSRRLYSLRLGVHVVHTCPHGRGNAHARGLRASPHADRSMLALPHMYARD